MASSGDTEATRLTKEPNPGDQITNHLLDPCNHSEDLHLGVAVPSAEGTKTTITNGTNLASTRFILPKAPCQTNGKMSDSFPSTLEIESADIIHGASQMPEGHARTRLPPRRGSAIPRPSHWGGDQEPMHPLDCKRTLVLCFDGTGNKFKGNPGDTNILKIFSMLDRRKGDQYHYYQRESASSRQEYDLTVWTHSWYWNIPHIPWHDASNR